MLPFQWVTHPHRIENNAQGLRGHRGSSSRARNKLSEGSLLLYGGKRRKRATRETSVCVQRKREGGREIERERNDGLKRRWNGIEEEWGIVGTRLHPSGNGSTHATRAYGQLPNALSSSGRSGHPRCLFDNQSV